MSIQNYTVEFLKDEKGNGHFFIAGDEGRAAEMVVHVAADHLTVYHTEVAPEYEGKGLAKELLAAMVGYARKHQLKVIPLCTYVQAQFKRHPQEYEDVWLKRD
ncbi:GNAT family N-acetyltransferase [Foetidibacter luteolus]|uniref:GNAT family N-acetyltransferase n=1 Tax=Foetidibacter luteolus TaxID=2608880 RepID=UPI00129ABC88|nr:GNAT family N-acetyltransferase [Foetidibacter luteolus]